MRASAQQVKGQWEGKGKLPTPAEARRAPTGPFGVPGHARHGCRGWVVGRGQGERGREGTQETLGGWQARGAETQAGTPGRGARGAWRGRGQARGAEGGTRVGGSPKGARDGAGRAGAGGGAGLTVDSRTWLWKCCSRADTSSCPSIVLHARPRGRRCQRLRGRLGKPRAREDWTGQDETRRGWGGAPTSEESAGAGDDVTDPAGGATGRDEGEARAKRGGAMARRGGTRSGWGGA